MCSCEHPTAQAWGLPQRQRSHLQQSLQVANPKDMAQPLHSPEGADLALLTCGSNGRRDNSLLVSPSGHCSPARSTPGEQWDRLRAVTLISQAGNGCTWLTNCPHLLEQHQVKALPVQRVPDEPDALLPPLAQVADGPAREG